MIQEEYPKWDEALRDDGIQQQAHVMSTAAGALFAGRFDEPAPEYPNPSGFIPVEFKVLVRLDPVETITRGGIVLPQTAVSDSQIQQQSATLIAVGGRAFDDFGTPCPKPGDRVLIARYSGERPKANDTEQSLYRICNDKDICAIVRKS